MKIDNPTNAAGSQPLDSVTTRKVDFKKPGHGFNEVFRQQMAQHTDSPAVFKSRVHPPAGVSPLVSFAEPLKKGQVVEQALDTLELYVKQLNDPDASLRTIGPTVGQMKTQAASLKRILADLTEENPMRKLVEETHDLVCGEIERFDTGYYVDA